MANKQYINTGSTRCIFQDFLLLWLDDTLDESKIEFKKALTQLKQIVALIKMYKDAEEGIQFIQEVKDQKVFIIISRVLGQRFLSDIHEWSQIDSIYIFCGNESVHEKSIQKLPKIKGVYSNIQSICKALRADCQQCNQSMISVSFQKFDPFFMYIQLVKDAFLQIEDDNAAAINDFIEFCHQQNNIDKEQIKFIKENYKKHTPIWWYTAPTFMYFTINRGIWLFDVNILLRMGFFIRHLHRHIQELFHEQQRQSNLLSSSKIVGKAQFEVYRGQGLSNDNFEKLKKTRGGLISFNTFLSASQNKMMSLQVFAKPAAFIENSVGILFIMKIDSDLCKKFNIPFVEVTKEMSYYKSLEEEILFSTHTLFTIEEINRISDPDTHRLYQVNLTLTSPHNHGFNELAETMCEDIGNRSGLSKFAFLLNKSGLVKQAQQLYHILLEKVTLDEDLSEYNYQLGRIYDNSGDYEKAIQYYEKYYEIMRKRFQASESIFTNYYNNIGAVYSTTGEYLKALLSYQQLLEIKKKTLPSNHPDLADNYNNIGNMYYHAGQYLKALSSYQQSLEIYMQVLPSNHPNLAGIYNNVGAVHRKTGDYSKALSSHQQSLEISKQCLPENHLDLANSYLGIGNVYYSMHEYSKALSSYQKSLEIQKQVLPSSHPDLAAVYHNIGLVYNSMGEYSNALSSYQQSLEIKKQVLPWNSPSLANIHHDMGLVYDNMNEYSKALLHFETAIKIREDVLPSIHADLANSYYHMGAIYAKQNMFTKSSRLLEKALYITKQMLSTNHPDLAKSYWSLGLIYSNMGEYEKALLNHEQALTIRKKLLSATHSDLSKSFKEIGSVYRNMHNYTKALSCYEQALRIGQKSLPLTHPYIASLRKDIKNVKRKL